MTSNLEIIKNLKALIEIPTNSSLKIEYENGKPVLDRITPKAFPFNYGEIQNTMAKDGDPLDIIILSSQPLPHGILTKFYVLGILKMSDEKGEDDKIIAKLPDKVDPEYKHIKSLDDVSPYLLQKIKLFFETYKALEPEKWVKVNQFEKTNTANDIIIKSLNK